MSTASGRSRFVEPLLSGDLLPSYRRLAARVVEQALRDLDCASPTLRHSARVFLSGNALLTFWCDLAQIPAGRVVARVGQHPSPGSRIVSRRLHASAGPAKLASARSSVS